MGQAPICGSWGDHRAHWQITMLMARPERGSGTAQPILLYHRHQQHPWSRWLSGELGVGRANTGQGRDSGQGSPRWVYQRPGRLHGMAGLCTASAHPMGARACGWPPCRARMTQRGNRQTTGDETSSSDSPVPIGIGPCHAHTHTHMHTCMYSGQWRGTLQPDPRAISWGRGGAKLDLALSQMSSPSSSFAW